MNMKFKIPTLFSVAGLCASSVLIAQDEAAPAADKPAAADEAAAEPAPPAVDPAAPEVPAAPKLDPAVVKKDSSYGFGFRSGMQFSQQTSRFGLSAEDLDRETFVAAFFDAFDGKDPAKSEEEINAALQALGEQLQEREKVLAAKTLAAGEAFLAENKKRDGVITTESGLQYEILKKGEGPVFKNPDPTAPPRQQFLVHYKGTLIDGTEFDASPEGQTVPMTLQVIPGFQEALKTMPVGSKWKLFIPANLAYGEQRRGQFIKPNSTLIFDLELVNIQEPPAPATPPGFQLPPGAGQPQPGRRPTAVSPPVRVPIKPKGESTGEAPAGDKPAAE